MSNYGADVNPDMVQASKVAYEYRFAPRPGMQFEQWTIASDERVLKFNDKSKAIQVKFLVDQTQL